MKINTEKTAKYAELGDADLWREIITVAGGYGFKLECAPPSHAEMERIRGILRGEEKINMAEGMKLINTYKSKR